MDTGSMKVVPIDQMPRAPWEPKAPPSKDGHWMTIDFFDRWIKPYCQTWFWMRAHRVGR